MARWERVAAGNRNGGVAAQHTPPPPFFHTTLAYVNSLTSFETELPYEYYTLPFCKPPEGVRRVANQANLGTIIQGLRIENSPYNFSMMVRVCVCCGIMA